MTAASGDTAPATTARARMGRERQQALENQARAAWMLACDLAARATGADVREVVQTRGTPGRGSSNLVALARKQACYLASVVSNIEPAYLARAAKLDRKTLAEHCAWVEDRRDDPAFDRVISGMEETLWIMAARIVLARVGGLNEPAEAA